jgi:hypothetical protein
MSTQIDYAGDYRGVSYDTRTFIGEVNTEVPDAERT